MISADLVGVIKTPQSMQYKVQYIEVVCLIYYRSIRRPRGNASTPYLIHSPLILLPSISICTSSARAISVAL